MSQGGNPKSSNKSAWLFLSNAHPRIRDELLQTPLLNTFCSVFYVLPKEEKIDNPETGEIALPDYVNGVPTLIVDRKTRYEGPAAINRLKELSAIEQKRLAAEEEGKRKQAEREQQQEQQERKRKQDDDSVPKRSAAEIEDKYGGITRPAVNLPPIDAEKRRLIEEEAELHRQNEEKRHQQWLKEQELLQQQLDSIRNQPPVPPGPIASPPTAPTRISPLRRLHSVPPPPQKPRGFTQPPPQQPRRPPPLNVSEATLKPLSPQQNLQSESQYEPPIGDMPDGPAVVTDTSSSVPEAATISS